jgi:hypothetical protein
MKRIILHHHLGLGDHFICNGLVNKLSEQYDVVYLPCKYYNFVTVKSLYSENKKVKLFKIVNDEFLDIKSFSSLVNSPILMIGFGNCNYNNWEESFYAQVKLNYSERYDSFILPVNNQESEKLYDELVGDKKEYILVHRNSSDSDNYPINIWKGREEKISDIQIVEVLPNKADNLLSYIKIIKNSKEIHCVPSSFYCLVDSISDQIKSKLFYHDIRINSIVSVNKLNSKVNKWNIINYDTKL